MKMQRSIINKISFGRAYNKLFNNVKIKAKLLIGFIALACIPLLITGYLAYSRASTIITNKISSFSILLTNQVSREISQDIVGIETEATRILTLKETSDLLYKYSNNKVEDKWSIAQELRMIMTDSTLTQRTDVSSLLLDSNLNIIYMSFYPKSEKEEIIDISDVKNILGKTNDYRVFIEGMTTFRKEKVPVIIKPVTWYLDNSKIIGYHIIAFDKKFMKKIYNSVNWEEGSNIFVLNRFGNLVSGSDTKDIVGEDLTKRKSYLLNKENKVGYRNLKTNESLITFSNIAKTGWYLVSEIPISSLTKQSREMGMFIGIIVIACLFGAIIVSLLISKQIAIPLINLVRNMKEAEGGNLDTNIGIVERNDEIGYVTRGFKNMIEKVRMLIRSIEEKNIQLTIALEELKKAQKRIVEAEKLAALGKLVSGVAHQINTPVGVSITAASFIKSKTILINELFKSGNIKKTDLDSYIMSCDDSASIIVKDLSIASKIIQCFKQISAHQDEEEKRIFDSYELHQIITSLAPMLKNTNHCIDVKCEEGFRIVSFPGAFHQILSNLIDNSISHAFNENITENIIIEISKKDEMLILKYSDNGIGISPENMKDIYEPFFTTKRVEGKIGLGLSIVYNIVSQVLKGSITCESELGQGTSFTLTIPDMVCLKE